MVSLSIRGEVVAIENERGETLEQEWTRVTKDAREAWRRRRRELLEHGVSAEYLGWRFYYWRAMKVRYWTTWIPSRVRLRRVRVEGGGRTE